MALLVQRQDELLLELKAAAGEGFQRAKEWERTVTGSGNECFHAAWVLLRETDVSPAEKKQEKSKAGTASVEGSSAPRAASLPPEMMRRRRTSIRA